MYWIYPVYTYSLITIISPLLKEMKPECYCSVSLTDKLCAALIHSLHFHMWSLFYHWFGTEKEEQVDRAGAAVLGNLPLRGMGI